MNGRWKKYVVFFFLALGVGLACWLGGFVWFGYKINNYGGSVSERTDAIVVPTGGRNRIAEAVRLLNDGAADYLFISGVSEDTRLADIMQSINIEVDMPERVELGYKATNTIENAEEIKEWIVKKQLTSVRLITSNYHIPRSLAELEVYHLPLNIVTTPVYSAQVSHYWWQSWGTFKFIFSEYNKYLVVLCRNLFK